MQQRRGNEPLVTCISCWRQAKCVTVSDGTVYRPLAWQFDDGGLLGTCGACQWWATQPNGRCVIVEHTLPESRNWPRTMTAEELAASRVQRAIWSVDNAPPSEPRPWWRGAMSASGVVTSNLQASVSQTVLCAWKSIALRRSSLWSCACRSGQSTSRLGSWRRSLR